METQNQAISKIKSLEDEIDTHQQHINTLKRELSDAVRREYDESVSIHQSNSEINTFIRKSTDLHEKLAQPNSCQSYFSDRHVIM